MPAFLRRLIARIKYRHFDRDLERELAAHRAMVEDDLRARGLSPDDATPAAARALGNVTYMREEARGVWIARWLEQLWQDLRYAGRQYRTHPGFSVTVVLTLGVALGLLTSVFAVINGLYLRTWDVPQSEELFVISAQSQKGFNFRSFTREQYQQLAASLSQSEVAAMEQDAFDLNNGADTELRVDGHWVSPDFDRLLRLPLAMGTGLSEAGSLPHVVVSSRVWRLLYGGRTDVLGQRLIVGGKDAIITGVLDSGFKGFPPDHCDILINLGAREGWQPGWADPRRSQELELVGRPRPGATRDTAVSELEAIAPGLLSSPSHTVTAVQGLTTTFADMRAVRGRLPRLFALLFTGTVLVLALACANVGNLTLARCAGRRREFAIRLSLGASRLRVTRQLLVESLGLTIIAASLGLWISTLLPSFVLSFDTSRDLWIWTPDMRTYAFSALATVCSCGAFAVAPALRGIRSARLAHDAREGRSAGRLRSIILTVQIASAIALVLAASLLIRGLAKTAWSNGGYAMQELAVASILKPSGTYSAERSRALLNHVERELTVAAPGAFGLTPHPPLANRIDTLEDPASGRLRGMSMNAGSFDAIGLRLLDGRVFSDSPDAGELVVNEALATRLWPGSPAIGQRLADHIVVGIAADARLTDATRAEPLFFRALQSPTTFFVTFRRQSGAEDRVRQVVTDFDPRLTVRVAPLTASVMDDLRGPLMGAAVASGLAALALLLSIVGVAGVAAFIVAERRREIGIRLALGARRGDIRAAVATVTRWPLLGGAAAGIVVSLLGGAAMRGFLIDISPFDPVSYAVVGLVILGAAIAAAAVPMRRALAVDPAITLRSE